MSPPFFSVCSHCETLNFTVTCNGFGQNNLTVSFSLFLRRTNSTSVRFLPRLGISSSRSWFHVARLICQLRHPNLHLLACGRAHSSAHVPCIFQARLFACCLGCFGSCCREFKLSGLSPLTLSAATKLSCMLLPRLHRLLLAPWCVSSRLL